MIKKLKLQYCLLFFLLCIILGCPAAKSKVPGQSDQKESPYNIAIPIEKILEDFDAELDVSKTLKAHGGFYNPTRNTKADDDTLIRVQGINERHYTVVKEPDGSDEDKKMKISPIYGFDHDKDVKDLILHMYSFYLYKEAAQSVTITGTLLSVKDPSAKTVIVQGNLQLWNLSSKTNTEKQMNIYFGHNYENGKNGGVVFDENNIAISGTLIIESFIRLDDITFEEYYNNPHPDIYKRQYDIEKLTDIEKAELKKLNLFDIAP